jgi:hypothetical protein
MNIMVMDAAIGREITVMMMKSLDRRLHNEKTETLNILLIFNFPGTLFRCFVLKYSALAD